MKKFTTKISGILVLILIFFISLFSSRYITNSIKEQKIREEYFHLSITNLIYTKGFFDGINSTFKHIQFDGTNKSIELTNLFREMKY